jgi:hypothetical protein
VQRWSRGCRRRCGSKRKAGIIELNMAGDDDLLGGTIKAVVAMMFGRIPKEHIEHGAWCKLVRCNIGGVGVTKTSKNPKTDICRVHTEKYTKGNAIRDCFRRQSIM